MAIGRALVCIFATIAIGDLPGQGLTWFTNPANGHRYALTAPMPWLAAEAEAQRAGGHLATIRNRAENDWLFQTFGSVIGQGGVRLWIGFTDQAEEGTWIWSSGEVVAFTAWASGQPDDASNQDHGYLWETPLGTWADEHGANSHRGIIEVSVTASFSTFGLACPGSQGSPVLEAADGSLPIAGRSFVVELRSLPTGILNVVFGILGTSRTASGSLTLPFDLTTIGMNGCTLYVSTDDAVALTNRAGIATWALAIPADVSLYGARIYQQGFVMDPGANPLGAITTNAGRATIGPF